MEATAMAWTVGVVGLGLLYWFVWVMGAAEVKGKRAVNLKMGSITRDKVKDKYTQYWSFFRRPKETVSAADKVPAFVDTFYNLVTDIYEWGWGQSFHFSPPSRAAPTATPPASTRSASPSSSARALASACSTWVRRGRAHARHRRAVGAHIVGITINEYQVARARAHNRKARLDAQCEVVCGNFLQMPFPNASFDGAYSIEATCHAPRLQDVYAEVFRVLRPGGLYVSYEWVTTPLYRAADPDHVDTIQGIERGDALPGLRAQDEIAAIAAEVGFEVLQERTWRYPPRGPGGPASRWVASPTGVTTSSSPSSPSSASPPRASSRSTRCSTRPRATSPAAARPASSPPCT
uniref:SAM-dependent methyltransferase Erg6/SMT-type domain-containing protein n=1 Tax=Ananas comosus var. bracteatus TaxID=296719 RepID=A0A6V7QPA7_ANACO|nr:unnamed protein product [Ananas comosus var. bracteatus]